LVLEVQGGENRGEQGELMRSVRLAERLGFSREYFVGAVTSGTLAAPALAAGEFGSTCLFFTWGDDDPRALRFVEQAALRPVATVAAADFIVAHGAQVPPALASATFGVPVRRRRRRQWGASWPELVGGCR
jgi:hypothetical protein